MPKRSLICLWLCVYCGLSVKGDQVNTLRNTKYGAVLGLSTGLSQKYLGIPFAAPAERWRVPGDPVAWTGVYNATLVRPMCYQGSDCKAKQATGLCAAQMSEDCLFLNIFAPRYTRPTSGKAVMIYIHGGAFSGSSGGAPAFDGEEIVSKGDVLVVTINYRLGAFGFLVTGQTSADIAGNYGILDQIQALKWVHENIASFGGDPDRVTLFGQSAGASSIAIHMTSDTTSSLFRRVILQSLPFSIPLKPPNVAISEGMKFVKMLNCSQPDVVDCLKSKPASLLASVQETYSKQVIFPDSFLRNFQPWTPHIDGSVITVSLSEAIKKGPIIAKPMIIGTTSEEGEYYIPRAFPKPISVTEYRYLLSNILPGRSDLAFLMYSPSNLTDCRKELTQLLSDFLFVCPSRMLAKRQPMQMPVFLYVFDNVISWSGAWNNIVNCINKVCHGADLPYVFQYITKEQHLLTDDEFRLSDSIISYWTTFAKSGKPSCGRTTPAPYSRKNTPPWPRYISTEEQLMVLKAGSVQPAQGFRSAYCDVWDMAGEYMAKK